MGNRNMSLCQRCRRQGLTKHAMPKAGPQQHTKTYRGRKVVTLSSRLTTSCVSSVSLASHSRIGWARMGAKRILKHLDKGFVQTCLQKNFCNQLSWVEKAGICDEIRYLTVIPIRFLNRQVYPKITPQRAASSRMLRQKRASPNAPPAIPSDIPLTRSPPHGSLTPNGAVASLQSVSRPCQGARLPPTCWKVASTSGPSRTCWDTVMYQPP